MKYIFDKNKINENGDLNTESFLGILKEEESERLAFKGISTTKYISQNSLDMRLLKYDKNKDCIREKTKIELYNDNLYALKDGEILQNGEILQVEKPSKWHTWDKDKWVVDLAVVKSAKREELKSIREEKILENIEVHGSLFQVREKDLENFEDVARAIRRGKRQLTDRRMWVIADNSVKEFTYAELLDVLDERAERKDKIFAQFAILSMQLEKCENVDNIENIKF